MGANKRELIPIHRFSYKIKKTQKSKRQARPITQVQTSKACESGCMSVIMVVQFFFSFLKRCAVSAWYYCRVAISKGLLHVRLDDSLTKRRG